MLSIFNHGARKRKNFLEHETCTKRCVNICSLDQYGLGLKRMYKLFTMLKPKMPTGVFFMTLAFLAPGPRVLPTSAKVPGYYSVSIG